MNKDLQHTDIEIPDIEIDRGWTVSELYTIDDCDDAFAFLTSAIAQIEFHLELEDLKPEKDQRKEWRARSRVALRFKKAALQIVGVTRGKLVRETEAKAKKATEHMVLNYVREQVGEEKFLRWLADAKARAA